MTTSPFQFRKLLTMAQVGEQLQKSSEAARKWARRGKVPMTKVGREWRVDQRDLDRKLAEDTNAAIRGQKGRSK
jgi:excisionase family DNA binding protein